MAKKLRVGIIFGGRSGEHEVSLRSAASIMAALDPEQVRGRSPGHHKGGTWLVGGDPLKELQAAAAEPAMR